MLLVGWAGLVFAQNFSVGARLDLATGANTDLVAIGGVNVDGDSDSAPANHSANSALPFQVAAAEHGGWQLLPTSAYSLSNLVGTWQFNILASGPGAPWWARVTAEVAPDGSFTSSMTESSGGGGTTNGLFSISPGGVVTTSLSPTARGVLDAGMTVTVGTDTWAGYASGTTMSARPCPGSC